MSKAVNVFVVINLQTLWLGILTKLGEWDSFAIFLMGFIIADVAAFIFSRMEFKGD
ncbi:hypothetical protein [Acinetobacter soli]|uniref:hypothetical protein n=1 Tax=Acinetobacter soli TaxID=487316 RepID=UPI003AA86845